MKVAAAPFLFALMAVNGPATAAKFLEVPAPAKRLEILLGTWKGDATMTVNGHAITWKAKWSCGMVTGGWGVTCKLSGRIPGLGQYDETDVFGYDDENDMVHWFATTSRGEVHDHAGRWADGKTLLLEWKGAAKHEKLSMAVESGEVIVKSDVTDAGRPAMTMVLRLRK